MITYQPNRSVEETSKSSPERDAGFLLIHRLKFNLKCISTPSYSDTRHKILPQGQIHPPRLSTASQCGSTADDTAVNPVDAHAKTSRMRLVRGLQFLSYDWLTRLSVTRLPGNPNHLLAQPICHPILLSINILPKFELQTDCGPCV